jgi:hypothetical protein
MWCSNFYCRGGKSTEVGLQAVKKIYCDDRGAQRFEYIRNIYRLLKEKDVPHVDTLTHAVVDGSTIYVEPKGIATKPSNEKELLEAIVCVLQALQICTIILCPSP